MASKSHSNFLIPTMSSDVEGLRFLTSLGALTLVECNFPAALRAALALGFLEACSWLDVVVFMG